ncbi:MAG: DUF1566 domain-containing protein [Bacteroidales bacterium]
MRRKELPKITAMITIAFGLHSAVTGQTLTYPIAGTGQANAYHNSGIITLPQPGQPFYGQNANYPGQAPSYTDNGDGTVTDQATGLMWMQNDNGTAVLWEDALSYAENFSFAGYDDWRLPDVKELQGIIDYTRSPGTTNSAAINPLFSCTQIINEAGMTDFPFFWSSTTFCSQTPANGAAACYVSFGRAMGYMSIYGGWIDVHGAGAQRSDPKTGDPANFPYGAGPQGDAIRIYNYARLVRNVAPIAGFNDVNPVPQYCIRPNPVSDLCTVTLNKGYDQINIEIFNITGHKILDCTQFHSGSITLNLEELPEGIYFMGISAGGHWIVGKFCKI